LTISIL